MSAGQEGTRFAGRRVVQNPDFRIIVSMDEYDKSKFHPIEVSKGYLSNTKEIKYGMLTNIKGVNGGLGWLALTARPDMAAPHSIIPSGYDRRSPQLISEVNAAVKQGHAVPITITIWPILFAELRWTTFTDSGFDTGDTGGATATPTRLVSVCHKQVLQPRTVGASECASLAESEAYTKSGESTTCSRPLKTMMPHVIRNENPAHTTILRAHSLWMPKVCLMRRTMFYLRMTERPPGLKNSCTNQCVDLYSVHTIEMQLTP